MSCVEHDYCIRVILQVGKRQSLLVERICVIGCNFESDIEREYRFFIHANCTKSNSFVIESRCITRNKIEHLIKGF